MQGGLSLVFSAMFVVFVYCKSILYFHCIKIFFKTNTLFTVHYRRAVYDSEGDFVNYLPSTKCNSGLKVTDYETGDTVFFYQQEQNCLIHKSCENSTITMFDKNSGNGCKLFIIVYEWAVSVNKVSSLVLFV